MKSFQEGKNPEYPSGAKNSPQTGKRPQPRKQLFHILHLSRNIISKMVRREQTDEVLERLLQGRNAEQENYGYISPRVRSETKTNTGNHEKDNNTGEARRLLQSLTSRHRQCHYIDLPTSQLQTEQGPMYRTHSYWEDSSQTRSQILRDNLQYTLTYMPAGCNSAADCSLV